MDSWDGRCPYCGETKFYEGPEGGLCINLMCSRCEAKINVARIPGAMQFDRLTPPRTAHEAARIEIHPSVTLPVRLGWRTWIVWIARWIKIRS